MYGNCYGSMFACVTIAVVCIGASAAASCLQVLDLTCDLPNEYCAISAAAVDDTHCSSCSCAYPYRNANNYNNNYYFY